jgi:hypothetical protein
MTAFLAAALAGASLSGCGTLGADRPGDVRIAVSPGGRITVMDSPVELSRLGARLESRGIGKQARILVSVPPGAGAVLMEEITRQLASAGYTRFVFVRPRRQISVTTEP